MTKLRIFAILFAVIMLFSSFSVFAEYNLDDYPFDASREYPRVQAKAYEGSPTLDADITDSEGWSNTITYNHTNMLAFWNPSSRCIINADVRYAWDDEGLYIAADITDPTMVASNDVDNEAENSEYGWNGDVFIFALDPLNQLYEHGMTRYDDISAWYCFSVNEAGKLMCYVSNTSSPGDITNRIEGEAALTDGGWKFEAMISWSRIINDTADISYGDVTIDTEEIARIGSVSNAGLIYMDRAVNDGIVTIFTNDEVEEGEIFVLSRNICVPVVHDDGMDYNNGGASIRSYGTELVMADETGYAPEEDSYESAPPDAPTEPDESVDADTAASATDTTYGTAPHITSPDKLEVTTFNADKTTKTTTDRENDNNDEDEEEEKSSDSSSGTSSDVLDIIIIAVAAGIIIISGIIIAFIVAKKIKSNK